MRVTEGDTTHRRKKGKGKEKAQRHLCRCTKLWGNARLHAKGTWTSRWGGEIWTVVGHYSTTVSHENILGRTTVTASARLIPRPSVTAWVLWEQCICFIIGSEHFTGCKSALNKEKMHIKLHVYIGMKRNHAVDVAKYNRFTFIVWAGRLWEHFSSAIKLALTESLNLKKITKRKLFFFSCSTIILEELIIRPPAKILCVQRKAPLAVHLSSPGLLCRREMLPSHSILKQIRNLSSSHPHASGWLRPEVPLPLYIFVRNSTLHSSKAKELLIGQCGLGLVDQNSVGNAGVGMQILTSFYRQRTKFNTFKQGEGRHQVKKLTAPCNTKNARALLLHAPPGNWLFAI